MKHILGKRVKVGIIGCGAIGKALAQMIEAGKAGDTVLSWVYDLKRENCENLVKKLKSKPKIAREISEIYADNTTEVIVEAASQGAVRQYALDTIRSGKDLIILSVGALSDDGLLRSLQMEARRHRRRIYIPSGAVIGMDGVKSSALGEIQEAILTTRKPPSALRGNEFLKKKRIKLAKLKRPKVIFKGTAREAVKAFPASVNVAATLSLAGAGFDRTRVKIIADPRVKKNIHEIRVRSKAGVLFAESHNVPLPKSPRTSYLAALSAARTLKNLSDTIQVGT